MSSAFEVDTGTTGRRVHAAELYALVLVGLDVVLTQLVAVQGPATEIGLGAVHWIAAAGWPGLLAAQLVAVGAAFTVARLVARWDEGLGHQVRGLVAGMWTATVAGNAAIALHVGVIQL